VDGLGKWPVRQCSVFFPFLFFFIFFAKPTGHTVRQIWTNDGSKCVVPRKDLPFGGMNYVRLNFVSQTQKN